MLLVVCCLLSADCCLSGDRRRCVMTSFQKNSQKERITFVAPGDASNWSPAAMPWDWPSQSLSHTSYVNGTNDKIHNHHLMGFVGSKSNQSIQGKPNTADENQRHTVSTPLDNITNQYTHHLDCFHIHELQPPSPKPHKHTIQRSSASKALNTCMPGLPSEKHSQTRLLNSGMNPRRADTSLDAKETEELRCRHSLMETLTKALFSDETTDLGQIENTWNINSGITNISENRLSEHDVLPGADTPMTIINIDKIQGVTSRRPLRALVDTGSKRTFIYKSALPIGCKPIELDDQVQTKLLDRVTQINQTVMFKDMVLPELSSTTHIVKPFNAYVVDVKATSFDIILGQDFNVALGINVINSQRVIQWNEKITPFRVVPIQTNRFKRASLHSALGLSPGALVFNRDMLLDIPVIADYEALQHKRMHIVKKNLERANRPRIKHHDYAIGDKILKLIYQPTKLQPRAEGPYTVTRVHVNGTITFQRTPLTTERINICHIKPFLRSKQLLLSIDMIDINFRS